MKNQLSRIALSGLLATGLTLCSAAAFAQQNAAPAPDASTQQPANGPGRMGHQQMNPDEQVAHMAKRYSLSADQQTQIKPILANQQQQMQALRQDSTLSREDKMAKMKGIHEDSSTRIQAILNDTQKQKFTQDQQKMEARRQERTQERNAPPTAQ
jgi:periplasmic protein CpxP/Spy